MEDQYTVLIISNSFLLRMRNILNESGVYKNTHFLFSNFFPHLENRAVGGIMLRNTGEPDRPQLTIWRMRIACWIPKATNMYSEYIILIAFPLQEWLHERTTMLRYTYIACHV
jgi:hypothetical protein